MDEHGVLEPWQAVARDPRASEQFTGESEPDGLEGPLEAGMGSVVSTLVLAGLTVSAPVIGAGILLYGLGRMAG